MAGSHDPKDVSANSLPRVLAAVLHAGSDVAGAIALGGRVFAHHAPVTPDPRRLPSVCGDARRLRCRAQAASAVLQGVPEPVAGCFGTKPLRKDVRSACTVTAAGKTSALPEVLRVLAQARRIVDRHPTSTRRSSRRAVSASRTARRSRRITGTLYGALHGFDALPVAAVDAAGRT